MLPTDSLFNELRHASEPDQLLFSQHTAASSQYAQCDQAEDQRPQEHLSALDAGDRRVHQACSNLVIEQTIDHHDRIRKGNRAPVRREVNDRGGMARREENVSRQIAVNELSTRFHGFAERLQPGDQPRYPRGYFRCRLAPGNPISHRPRMLVDVQSIRPWHVPQSLVEGSTRSQQGIPSTGRPRLAHHKSGRRPSLDDVTPVHGAQKSRDTKAPSPLQPVHQPRSPLDVRAVTGWLQHDIAYSDTLALASFEQLRPSSELERLQNGRRRQGCVSRGSHTVHLSGPTRLHTPAFQMTCSRLCSVPSGEVQRSTAENKMVPIESSSGS